MIAQCYRQPTRAVAIREIQKSIRDSVHQLLADKIQKLGLASEFQILETEIRGPRGSHIIFRGMQSFNADTIKSLEGYDLAWVEEAQTLSQRSLDLLRPTIRKPESEIWFGWNPRFRTDPVDEFFRKNPHPDSVCVEVNWRDNPWFPDVLRKDMERDKEVDPELADHIWEGGYEISHGAILARLVDRAEKEGRITDDVEYDRKGPGIEISCDLGFHDTSTWWFWQRRLGGAVVIDYDRGSGLQADDWAERIRKLLVDRKYKLRHIWLPHDAASMSFVAKYTAAEIFGKGFGTDRVSIVPRTSKSDRINAARLIIGKTKFHKTRVAAGLDGLRAWQFEWDDENRIFSREPRHDWASHDGDGFSYGCQVMAGLEPPDAEPVDPIAEMLKPRTFNDLMAELEERDADV